MVTIFRQWGKTLLLLSLMTLIGTLMMGALIISQAVHLAEENLWLQIPPVAIVSNDFDRMWNENYDGTNDWWKGREYPTPEVMAQVWSHPYVKGVDVYHETSTLFSERYRNLEVVVFDWLSDEGYCHFREPGSQVFWTTGVLTPDFSLLAQGIISIVEGSGFLPDDFIPSEDGAIPVILPVDLARKNGWETGGYFSMDQRTHALGQKIGQRELTFHIRGLFEFLGEGSGRRDLDANHSQRLTNRLFIPLGVSEAMDDFAASLFLEHDIEFWESRFYMQIGNHVITLYDPRLLPGFVLAADALLEPYYFRALTPSTFGDVLQSIGIFDQFSEWVFFGAAISFVPIVMLVHILSLHSRRDEFHLYLFLGEKRKNLAG